MAERKPTIQKEVSSFAERTKDAVPYEVTEPVEVAERVPQIVTPEEPITEVVEPKAKPTSKKKKKSVK